MSTVHSASRRDARLRVLVIDDQAAYRDAVATVVGTETGFELVAALGSARDVDEVIERVHPDLILLDVRMPDLDGAAVAVDLRLRHPDVTVLLMSVCSPDEIPHQVSEAGVRFVEKENFGSEILFQMRAEVARNRSRG